eukprot:CAMPEP_0198298568 /NCGR_PEP_ID=MMETSP1449-20131203/41277_1 /TAXON_ID=420275 /ORGANISM="Attheya septentrionalis, Strain CCMP2084" /LENGTH=90 /DNA_ID=CAMNT_0043999861 /DNA_START=46 /DNA_END=315 /DNA_ORIENTATION=+
MRMLAKWSGLVSLIFGDDLEEVRMEDIGGEVSRQFCLELCIWVLIVVLVAGESKSTDSWSPIVVMESVSPSGSVTFSDDLARFKSLVTFE